MYNYVKPLKRTLHPTRNAWLLTQQNNTREKIPVRKIYHVMIFLI